MRVYRLTFAALRASDGRQRFIALTVGVAIACLGGLVLASSEETLASLPGLLLLIPGAIALRGNVFGALGSRLGTSVHAGTFKFSVSPDGVVGQNLLSAAVLTFVLSTALAVLAKITAVVFGLTSSMSMADFIVVSVVGGSLASLVLALFTVILATASVRFGWDLDNVVAPLVTTLGDCLTVPALIFATKLVTRSRFTDLLAVVLGVVAVVALVLSWRTPLEKLRRIVRQSVPVLGLAVVLDLVAGLTFEKRLDDLLSVEALLVFLPAFLGAAGASGAILSSRLSTQFHLGLDDASPLPSRSSLRNIFDLVVLVIPVFVFGALISYFVAKVTNQTTPDLADLVLVSLIAGSLITLLMVFVTYYTTMGAFRFGLDPDTYGIPMVTSALDLFGAFVIVLVMVAVGVI